MRLIITGERLGLFVRLTWSALLAAVAGGPTPLPVHRPARLIAAGASSHLLRFAATLLAIESPPVGARGSTGRPSLPLPYERPGHEGGQSNAADLEVRCLTSRFLRTHDQFAGFGQSGRQLIE